MLLRCLLLLIVSLYCNLSLSQSIYEFDYYFDINKTREHYKALMVRYEDGTGFIRVKFRDSATHSWILVDMDMQEHYMGDEDETDSRKTDSSILVFEGIDPQVVTGPQDLEYDPDLFLFEKNKQDGVYDPLAVLSKDDNGKDVEGVVTEMRLLNEGDLTKELVSEYFTEKDEIYVNLFEEASVRAPTPQQKATRLFLVLVANTNDLSIGPTCKVDKDATYTTFSQLAEFLKIQFVPNVIEGKDFSKINVDNAINGIKPASNDIVVFYYSGHGFNDVKTNYKFPFLDLRDKTYQQYGEPYTLNIEDIFKRIKMKGARMNLVISDCCNADPSQSNIAISDGASTRTSSVGWNIGNCWSLFMNNKPGSILVTAAQKGELSAGNSTGGIFTFNFRESLDKALGVFYNNSSWNDVLVAAQKQTVNKAKRTWCTQPDNSKKVCVQNPVFRME
ncbi:MAG: caspase family protein [Chitinophagaceae bacterium]|nr:caspase family protein [Chitinophagaceae bacterium]